VEFPSGDDDTNLLGVENNLLPEHHSMMESKRQYNEDILPEVGPFLEDYNVLVGQRRDDIHETTRQIFEKNRVYELNHGYNLADLNYDARYPNSGYRYAEDGDILRAEFTPTDRIDSASVSPAVAYFRSWNGNLDLHPYRYVSVRVREHVDKESINSILSDAKSRYLETGVFD
jgi:hypothetical protein